MNASRAKGELPVCRLIILRWIGMASGLGVTSVLQTVGVPGATRWWTPLILGVLGSLTAEFLVRRFALYRGWLRRSASIVKAQRAEDWRHKSTISRFCFVLPGVPCIVAIVHASIHETRIWELNDKFVLSLISGAIVAFALARMGGPQLMSKNDVGIEPKRESW